MDVNAIVAVAREALAERLPRDLSLMSGLVGDAVLAAELDALTGESSREPLATQAVERFNTAGAQPGLHPGVAGLGLLFALYCEDLFDEQEQLLSGIDLALIPRLGDLPPASLRNGPAGIALYACLRHQTSSGQALIDALVGVFEANAVEEANGLCWNTPVGYAQDRGLKIDVTPVREFGAVHGVAAAVTGLAALARSGADRAIPLVRGGLRWLRLSARPAPKRYGWVLQGDTAAIDLGSSRWCTGDPGVVRARYLAANAIGDQAEQAYALEDARALARDWRLLYAAHLDYGRYDLCCGTTAVAQVFRRFYLETREPIFGAISDDMLAHSASVVASIDNHGFQFGRTGVLLALLSYASGRLPVWDCALGMSLPPSPGDARGP